jgi:hypothetical protein
MFKAPDVSITTHLYRTVVSPGAGGILTSALAVKWLTPHIRTISHPLLADIVSKRWQAVAGSAVIGFGIGYGAVSSLNRARLVAIAALLDYKGWLFNQKTTLTKVRSFVINESLPLKQIWIMLGTMKIIILI